MELESELKRLGFDLTSSRLRSVLFPHHVGHYVGLDVHDCGGYPKSRRLRAGQCVTVEPLVPLLVIPVGERAGWLGRLVGIAEADSIWTGACMSLTTCNGQNISGAWEYELKIPFVWAMRGR